MPTEWTKHYGYQELHGKDCSITLEPRPSYCDRGAFLAKLHNKPPLAREIDAADLWPRYYFDEARAKLDIEAWLDKRRQRI